MGSTAVVPVEVHFTFVSLGEILKIVRANSGILRAADQGENREGDSGSDSGAHPRAHRGPELREVPSSEAAKGKFGSDSHEELLHAKRRMSSF